MAIRSRAMVSYLTTIFVLLGLLSNVSSLNLRSASVVGPAWNLPRPSWSTTVLSTKPLPMPVDTNSQKTKTQTGSDTPLAQQTFLRQTMPGLTPLARQYADLTANQQNSNMYNPNLFVPIPDQIEPRIAQSVYAFSPSTSTPSLEAAMRYSVDTHPALVDSMQGEGEIYSVAS